MVSIISSACAKASCKGPAGIVPKSGMPPAPSANRAFAVNLTTRERPLSPPPWMTKKPFRSMMRSVAVRLLSAAYPNFVTKSETKEGSFLCSKSKIALAMRW